MTDEDKQLLDTLAVPAKAYLGLKHHLKFVP
jgi:hypothetical protein